MKVLKIIIVVIIAVLGIYSMNKINFYEKLMLVTQVNKVNERMHQRRGFQNNSTKENSEQIGKGRHGRNRSASHQLRGEGNQRRGHGMRQRGNNRNHSKWAIRLNFKKGIINVLYYTAIFAFIMEVIFLCDRLIRKKPLIT